MNPEVDTYLIDGCGRCAYYRTPKCKVLSWTEQLKQLRRIVLHCGLKEEFKWSQPCYTFQNNNILLVTAFKEYATLAFFKGSLLTDSNDLLVSPGKNSQAVRQLRFTTVEEILKLEATIKGFVKEAIEVEKAGIKVELKKNPEPIPEELRWKFDESPALKTAFEALTPGRQRGYILHFSQPKQSATRTARIEKCADKILKGEGLNDRAV